MNPVTSLILRQMRAPLIVIVAVFSIATLGMVLIPGVDDQGQVWRMDFFHALYFVSFTATTIGFGEIPYPLTDEQQTMGPTYNFLQDYWLVLCTDENCCNCTKPFF